MITCPRVNKTFHVLFNQNYCSKLIPIREDSFLHAVSILMHYAGLASIDYLEMDLIINLCTTLCRFAFFLLVKFVITKNVILVNEVVKRLSVFQ